MLKSHIGLGFLLYICCIFSEHLWRLLLNGFCTFIRKVKSMKKYEEKRNIYSKLTMKTRKSVEFVLISLLKISSKLYVLFQCFRCWPLTSECALRIWYCLSKSCLVFLESSHSEGFLNPFVPNTPFLYPLKTTENRTVSRGRERVHWEQMD